MIERSALPARSLAAGRLSLLVKAARMYHEEGILQPEIADRLSISQSRVSRLLKEAQRLGIVRTVVVTPPGYFSELEGAVREAFGLRDVIVAEAASDDEAGILSAVGSAAAAYLENTLQPGERLWASRRDRPRCWPWWKRSSRSRRAVPRLWSRPSARWATPRCGHRRHG